MIFFPYEALPDPPDGSTIGEYFGSGPKIVTLVN
jgi:hypothetical protein